MHSKENREAELEQLIKTFPKNMGTASIRKELRACRACRLVKLKSQFEENGCENCGTIKKGEKGEIELKLTPYFEGIVAVFDVASSWLSRAFNVVVGADDQDSHPIRVPGLYAFNMPGEYQQIGEYDNVSVGDSSDESDSNQSTSESLDNM